MSSSESDVDLALLLPCQTAVANPSLAVSQGRFDLRRLLGRDADLAEKLKRMVGFRNISVHEYQKINYEVVVRVIEKELADLIRVTDRVMELG